MKIFQFELETGNDEGQFGSVKAIIAKVVQLDNEAKINAVYLHPNKSISYPPAMTQHLFLLVDGEGWIKSESGEIQAVRQGQAIFWENDEWHESGTDSGMTAVIIDNINIQPVELMPLLQED